MGGSVFENVTSDLPKDKDPSRSVHKGDFDGDGVLDHFISNRQANRIYLNTTPHPQAGPAVMAPGGRTDGCRGLAVLHSSALVMLVRAARCDPRR